MIPNKLITEKSPYLLQHSFNPVNWFPWCDEAFNKARSENKPIFLSIGYSACHWCHVMEKESFEDKEVAKLLNDCFISIKVDREERPDIDNIYMTVCQIMTGGGGWPLSIFMTPDRKPFFSGTYFPKEGKYKRIGFTGLLISVKDAWENKRNEILESADKITGYLIDNSNISETVTLDENILKNAFDFFDERFDDQFGGFGDTPKFPSSHNLLFLLRYWKRTGDNRALEMVEKTLTAMRYGGIFDHIGFGFHRYSTDRQWLVPHFEKMLYDQAMMSIAYLETYQATRNTFYAQTAEEIFEYVIRDMTDPKSGFYSAEDADSEGEEGKFYVWNSAELKKLLHEEYAIIEHTFNVKDDGNYPDEAFNVKSYKNILHLTSSPDIIASAIGESEIKIKNKIELLRKKIFESRITRVHPLKDDKILTDWNGLMIAALALGGKILQKEKFTLAAIKAAEFIFKFLLNRNGKLLHRFRDGEAAINANLDDYAFFIWGLLELYEATFNPGYLIKAIELQNILDDDFRDEKFHGYFFSDKRQNDLIVRSKEIYDGAIPSGNSIAALNLIKLYQYTSDHKFHIKANRIIEAFSERIEKIPHGSTKLLCAVDFDLSPSLEIIVVPGNSFNKNELAFLFENFIPNKVVIVADNPNSKLVSVSPFLKNYIAVNGLTTYYVCQNYKCNNPTTDREEVKYLLDNF